MMSPIGFWRTVCEAWSSMWVAPSPSWLCLTPPNSTKKALAMLIQKWAPSSKLANANNLGYCVHTIDCITLRNRFKQKAKQTLLTLFICFWSRDHLCLIALFVSLIVGLFTPNHIAKIPYITCNLVCNCRHQGCCVYVNFSLWLNSALERVSSSFCYTPVSFLFPLSLSSWSKVHFPSN